MKFCAVRNPNERWLMDLILLFIPSTAPLDTRCLVHDRTPSRCPRNMRTNFLNGSSRERMAERILLKFCTYFPYNAKLCLNGHEYAKRQLSQKGIGFEVLDNGVLSCDDPKRLQPICDGLSADKIDGLLRKWLRSLPHPYTGSDRRAGYRYDVSILQA